MIEDLRFKEQSQKAYEYAMFLLGIRLRTEGELREKMRSKKYEAGIIEQVLSQLKSNRYVDDKRFAEVFLDNLKKYKSWGFYGIKKKFMEKKLPADVIEHVLSEGLTEEEELETAKKFFRKEKIVIKNQQDKQKAARKLAAKGFRSSIVSKIVF